MRETNRNLTSLAQNKKLDERERLQMELDDVRRQLTGRDSEVKDLMHKLRVTEKSHKQQMNAERNRQAMVQKRLEDSLKEITSLKKDLKVVGMCCKHGLFQIDNCSLIFNRTRTRSSTAATSTPIASADIQSPESCLGPAAWEP